MAVVSILGALLGAGGSVAGGILSQPEEPEVFLPPTFDPSSDPLTALNTLDVMASQGVFAPGAILESAGPLQQAIERFRATRPLGGRNRDRARRAQAISDFLAGRQTTGSNEIALAGGFGSVREAHSAQTQFEQSVLPRLNNLEEIANLSRMRSLDVQRQLGDITASFRPLDFESLRGAEERRLTRGFDERQQEILRLANAADFNPGGALRGLEQRREDIDLSAISNAIGLLSGQIGATGQQVGLLNALDPTNRAQQLSPGVQQFRIPRQVSTPSIVQPQSDPFGAAVASASQQLGGGLISAGQQRQSDARFNQLLNVLQSQSRPAAGDASGQQLGQAMQFLLG